MASPTDLYLPPPVPPRVAALPTHMRSTAYPSSCWNEDVPNSIDAAFELPDCNFPICTTVDDLPYLSESRALTSPVPYPLSSGYASALTACDPTRSSSAQCFQPQRASLPAPLSTVPVISQTRKASRTAPAISSFQPTNMSPVTTPFVSLAKMRPGGVKLCVRPDHRAPTRYGSLSPSNVQVGRWTKREHDMFLEGLERFGRSWKKIASLVHTRTLVQIRTHAQKYLQKQSRAGPKAIVNDVGAASSSSSSSFTIKSQLPLTSTSTKHRKPTPSLDSAFQFKTAHGLDQLSQEETVTIPAFVDEYYTSPTAIEDELLRSLPTCEEWVHPSMQCTTSIGGSEPCRPLEIYAPAGSGTIPTSTALATSTWRPVVYAIPFEPLAVPNSTFTYSV